MNSLSQDDRRKRISEAQAFAVVDGDMESLLQQAEAVASAIRYYNAGENPDGYFDQFLHELNEIRQSGVEHFIPDGNLEPAQALLFTFLRQLNEISGRFNRRWKEYAGWYLDDILGVEPLETNTHKVCLSFTKTTGVPVHLKKGLGFRLKNTAADAPVYRLTDDMMIGNTSIENIISIYFCKRKDIYPASELGFVTSLNIKKLFDTPSGKGVLFGDSGNPKDAENLGFMITSPSFVLREGKRTVSIVLESENGTEIEETLAGAVGVMSHNRQSHSTDAGSQQSVQPEDSIRYLMLYNIFYIRFSVADGWELIENYSIKVEKGNIILRFTLNEEFPGTSPCTRESHDFESEFPALKVYLNLDAWLYPFSWFNKCLLKKIHIRTEVEGASNIRVYNDLGKVDCSKPFQPFGINTENGTWMVVGNYEAAIKNTQSLDLKIRWGQLPANEDGFRGYYAGYGQAIDNRSFVVQAKYLSGYKWKEDKSYPLFDVSPGTELNGETLLPKINISKMPVINIKEEQYEYSINARTGFVVFQLCSPEMGFGEKQYRNVFSDYITDKARKKNRLSPAPNTPFMPVVEKLTMNYVSEETVDLQEAASSGNRLEYFHITPLSVRKLYPHHDNRLIKPVFEMETHSNLLIFLKELHLGGMLSLYVDFVPHKADISAGQIPQIKLSLGNGYNWEPIPNGFIVEDKTMNLLMSGFIKISIPGNISDSLFDSSGRIWLKVGIEKNAEVIPSINKIHIHVAEAEFNFGSGENNCYNSLVNGAEWSVADEAVPGLSGTFSVASYSGREKESKEERLMRISEYASHRGKAVTARDYERIVLQMFPDIAKVKCLPSFDAKNSAKNTVTLVIVPRQTEQENGKYRKPMATSRQILNVEQFFAGLTSPYVCTVNVVNPVYEEVIARCRIIFKKRYPEALCHTRIDDLLNSMISPWQKPGEQPVFDYSLDMREIYRAIVEQEFVEDVKHLSIVVIGENADNRYRIYEYGNDDNRIAPSTPCSVFVSSKEHVIVSSDIEKAFGINEMSVGKSFIISESPLE
jgi:hypothetical protein